MKNTQYARPRCPLYHCVLLSSSRGHATCTNVFLLLTKVERDGHILKYSRPQAGGCCVNDLSLCMTTNIQLISSRHLVDMYLLHGHLCGNTNLTMKRLMALSLGMAFAVDAHLFVETTTLHSKQMEMEGDTIRSKAVLANSGGRMETTAKTQNPTLKQGKKITLWSATRERS